jgi:hypothetical protein
MTGVISGIFNAQASFSLPNDQPRDDDEQIGNGGNA